MNRILIFLLLSSILYSCIIRRDEYLTSNRKTHCPTFNPKATYLLYEESSYLFFIESEYLLGDINEEIRECTDSFHLRKLELLNKKIVDGINSPSIVKKKWFNSFYLKDMIDLTENEVFIKYLLIKGLFHRKIRIYNFEQECFVNQIVLVSVYKKLLWGRRYNCRYILEPDGKIIYMTPGNIRF